MDPEGLVDVNDHLLWFCIARKKRHPPHELFFCMCECVGPTINLAFLDSNIQLACRRDIESLIHNMKEYKIGIIFTPKFWKLVKHLFLKLEAKVFNHEHPYIINFPLNMQIFPMEFLGGGTIGNLFKCTFLRVMAIAKVWKMNYIIIKHVFCIVRISKRRVAKTKYKEWSWSESNLDQINHQSPTWLVR
jgi:hypothetical protein